MSRYRWQFQQCSAGWRIALAGAVLLLCGCGRPDFPSPPKAPPRPVTLDVVDLITADMVLPARPVRPSPGEM